MENFLVYHFLSTSPEPLSFSSQFEKRFSYSNLEMEFLISLIETEEGK